MEQSRLKPCPFCGSKDVQLLYKQGNECCEVFCFTCGASGAWSEDEAKCITSWNKRAGETFIPNRQLVMAAPKMYQLLKNYCGLIEDYVSIYDNFSEDLREICTKARDIIDEIEDDAE